MKEILGESVDDTLKSKVLDWINKKYPNGWDFEKQSGLWAVYYFNAFAECGLEIEDMPNREKTLDFISNYKMDFGCADFMFFRALAKLGALDHLSEKQVFDKVLLDNLLPDGGFLCEMKLKKFNKPPKSCYKVNLHALMFCAECKKKGINLEIENQLLDYFWKHNLFFRSNDLDKLIIDGRSGWRTIDTFHPFEPMRVGIHNVVEAFSALGYGKDERLKFAREILDAKKDIDGKYILDVTLSKSYLPKEKERTPSKWVTFYALLAESEREKNNEIR